MTRPAAEESHDDDSCELSASVVLSSRTCDLNEAQPWPTLTTLLPSTRPAPYVLTTGFTTAPATDRSATLMCLVNPTNPTGDYWGIQEMKAFIEEGCDAGTTVIVGENTGMEGRRVFTAKLRRR